MAEVVNTFRDGMRTDVSDHRANPNTYRYLSSGRTVWNELDGQGQLGDIVPLLGNEFKLRLKSGYTWIGTAKLGANESVCISTNGQYSEVGVFTQTGVGGLTYKALFNDQFDPNGDKLRFTPTRRLRVEVSDESPTKRMVYILDPNSSPIYCINLKNGYNKQGVAFHQNDSGVGINTYPPYWSVHHFTLQPGAILGDCYLSSTVTITAGGLGSGVYRYAYRLITEKYDAVSTFSHLSLPYFVTAERENAALTSHHERVMGPSGKGSHRANNIRFDNLDTRWWGIELGYTKAEAKDGYSEFVVIDRFAIPRNGADFVIRHDREGGLYSLPLEALSGLQAPIDTAADIKLHDNRLFIVAPKLNDLIQADVSAVSLQPVTRELAADETELPRFTSAMDVITNSTKLSASTFSLTRYEGVQRVYTALSDFANYKSPLYHAHLAGYRRESLTPLGLTLHDTKGQPGQVQPLGSFNAPTIGEAPLTKFNPKTGRYEVSALGISVSGIRLKKSDIIGTDGKLKVTGFSILRADSQSDVAHQGVIFPTTQFVEDAVTRKTPPMAGPFTFPLPWVSNQFADKPDRFSAIYRHVNGGYFYKEKYDGLADWLVTKGKEINANLYSRASNHTYYSPDVFIEQKHVFDKKTDSVKLVGTAEAAYGKDGQQIAWPAGQPGTGLPHYYNKAYKSTQTVNPNPGRPKMGDSVPLRAVTLLDIPNKKYEKYDPVNPDLSFESHQHVALPYERGTIYVDSLHTQYGLLLCTDGWEAVDVTNGATKACYHVVNYLKTQIAQAAERPDSANLPYYYTGHQQPLTLDILKTVPTQTINGEDYYVFNRVEVFGGNTYVNFTDFNRMMPFWADDCDPRESDVGPFTIKYNVDYSTSHIVALESKYNTALRYGRSFAKDSVRPQYESCTGKRKYMDNGIMEKQPESWGYNDALLVNLQLRQFFAPGPNQVYSANRPYSIYYSNQTIFGEIQDAKRTVLARNKRDLEGQYGPITNLGLTMDSLYAFQSRAIHFLPTKNRELLASSAASIYFGSGEVIELGRYINTEHGCQKYAGLSNLGHAIYWIDERTRHFCRFSQDGMSKLETDRMVRVETGHQIDSLTDYYILPHQNNEEVIVNLRGSSWPGFIFHEQQNAVQTILPVGFTMGEKVGKLQLVQVVDRPGIIDSFGTGAYNSFGGTVYPTILHFEVAHEPLMEKVWNHILVSVGGDKTALKTIQASSDIETHVLPIEESRSTRYWAGRWRLPLVEQTSRKARLRGQVLRYIFTFTLTDNKPFVLRDVSTVFDMGRHK